MRIVFMGSPEFSVPALEALLDAGHEVVAVYSQPPRPAGRGKKERFTPVHARAEALGLPVRHPVSLKTDEALAEFAALDAASGGPIAEGSVGGGTGMICSMIPTSEPGLKKSTAMN